MQTHSVQESLLEEARPMIAAGLLVGLALVSMLAGCGGVDRESCGVGASGEKAGAESCVDEVADAGMKVGVDAGAEVDAGEADAGVDGGPSCLTPAGGQSCTSSFFCPSNSPGCWAGSDTLLPDAQYPTDPQPGACLVGCSTDADCQEVNLPDNFFCGPNSWCVEKLCT